MKRQVMTGVLLCAMQIGLIAAPAQPGKTVYVQPDGTELVLELKGDEYYHYAVNEQGQVMEKGADGFYRPQGSIDHQTFLQRRRAAKMRREQARPNRVGGYTPASRGIVVIVQFSDVSCLASTTSESMNEMCNGENYTFDGAYGSARKYFREQSGGMYEPVFDVYGPITLSHNRAYYGANDENGYDMRPDEAVLEACQYADQHMGADFSQYDSDGDGYVDFVYMIYAGNGENISGMPEEYIWPHQSSMYHMGESIDGKGLGRYACSAELNGYSTTKRCGIGTLCHEFGHVLGLPDYYDTQYGTNYAQDLVPGTWDVMSAGCYNGDSKYPCNYTVYEKLQFDWVTVPQLDRTQSVTMAASSDYYYISLDGQPKTFTSTDTVLYLENRQKRGWDQEISGHGMMIWQLVYDEEKWYYNTPNNTDYAPNCIYIPADGTYRGGDAGDPFPGSSRVKTYEVPNTLYALNNITESGGVVSFRFVAGCDGYTVGIDAPHTKVVTTQTGDCYPADSRLVVGVSPKKNYVLDSVQVTMGDTVLAEGIDYTYENNVLVIPALTGDVQITVYTTKIPFDHESCMHYIWEPDSAVKGDSVMLSDVLWDLTVDGSSYRSFDSPATNRGAQFGSRSTSPERVYFHTDGMKSCLITEIDIIACVASGGYGVMSVLLDEEEMGKLNLSEEIVEYKLMNPEEWHGDVEIVFSNLTKALFVKRIVMRFEDEIENPDGLETVRAAVPQGPVTGIYSVTGQYVGMRIEHLPRGLYMVRHTDGTEKVLITD